MNNYEQRLTMLTPEQRKLFDQRVRQQVRIQATRPTVSNSNQPQLPSREKTADISKAMQASKLPLQFSLIFFSGDGAGDSEDKYEFVLEASRYADQNGFTAVWIPERHLHPFGGLYPNPSVLGAALATITQHIQIRAGSIVLPLHHPLRVVEEWSLVDNLSQGRVGLSFASGWAINDFILAAQPFAERRNILFERLHTVLKLWRGEAVTFSTPEQHQVAARAYPLPIQKDIAVWITSMGSSETWRRAGEAGAHVLTSLLQQSIEEMAANIEIYREARAKNGYDPDTGIVTTMLHTFIWDNPDVVYQKVHSPLLAYMTSHMDIYKQIAKTLGREQEAEQFSDDDRAVLAEYAFERYFHDNGLFGTLESCQALLQRLQSIGVDEIACLMDFGLDTTTLLQSMKYLNQLRKQHQQVPEYLP